ncbi:hypothetical protein RB628_31250 [Streptomyces sp. ADMS]|uniref:hypothetical protein n=1 Tax=Streptomyces sp. ADMS TaxID=3071415 RepID=UPI00296F7056|nr:hypothetical protein [Streptomyces sp. ADMS]MDW4909698.1 hypothetical protein [Streptomyces sp. ADMS]
MQAVPGGLWPFLTDWEIVWDRAERVDARHFVRWMRIADKPVRVRWRSRALGDVAISGITAAATPCPASAHTP